MMSIVIPTYNRSRLLGYTLHALTAQSIDPQKMEVIVVDDGSSDDTATVIHAFQSRLNLHYYYQEDRGYRVGRARNLGIASASSDVVLLIDAGILLHPDTAAVHLAHHERQATPIALIGIAYGFSTVDMELILPAHLKHPLALASLFTWLKNHPNINDIREQDYKRYGYQLDALPAPWVYFWTNHVSVRKSSLPVHEDFFDTRYEPHYGYEDIDLGYRLFQHNVRIQLAQDALAFHYPHKKINSLDEDLARTGAIFRNKFNSPLTDAFFEHGSIGFNDKLLQLDTQQFNRLLPSLEK